MSPAEGFNSILKGAGIIGGTSGFSSAIGMLFGSGAQVACIDSGGRGGEVKVAIDYPNVQILVRGPSGGTGYTQGWAKASEIYDYLQGINSNPTAYPNLVSCVARGYINPLGRDENDLPRFSLNWQLIIVPENEGNRTY